MAPIFLLWLQTFTVLTTYYSMVITENTMGQIWLVEKVRVGKNEKNKISHSDRQQRSFETQADKSSLLLHI